MGLNLSNQQIAEELDLNRGDVQEMTTELRSGVVERRPPVTLTGDVECDEVYVVAGHKGHPEVVLKKGALPQNLWVPEWERSGLEGKDRILGQPTATMELHSFIETGS